MKGIIQTDRAPKAIGPYSQGVIAGDFLFISGQLGLDPQTGAIVGQTAAEQAERALNNMGAILQAAGLGFEHVVKTTVLLKDINDFAGVNDVYGKYFKSDPPARAAYQVAALPRNGLVEIEATAYRR